MDALFVSRLRMPSSNRLTQHLLSNQYELHRTIMRAFPTPPGRVLFRIEPDAGTRLTDVIVQSQYRPDWSAASLPEGTGVDDPKSLTTGFQPGRRFRFRLVANPSVKRRIGGKRNGRREGVIGEDAQQAWLHCKASESGFRIDGSRVIDMGSVAAAKRDERLAFRAVRYEGILSVMNPETFACTLADGIGSGKGFGFGLLSIAPV